MSGWPVWLLLPALFLIIGAGGAFSYIVMFVVVDLIWGLPNKRRG